MMNEDSMILDHLEKGKPFPASHHLTHDTWMPKDDSDLHSAMVEYERAWTQLCPSPELHGEYPPPQELMIRNIGGFFERELSPEAIRDMTFTMLADERMDADRRKVARRITEAARTDKSIGDIAELRNTLNKIQVNAERAAENSQAAVEGIKSHRQPQSQQTKKHGRKLTPNELNDNAKKNELITEIRRRAKTKYTLGADGITAAYDEIDEESKQPGSKWLLIMSLATRTAIIDKARHDKRYVTSQ